MYTYSNPPLQTSSNFYMNVGPQPVVYNNNYYHHQPVFHQQRQPQAQQRRRKAIPRPWLVKKEQQQQQQHLQQQQQQLQPKESQYHKESSAMTQQKYQPLNTTTMKVEVWADEPSWSMSLSKLVSCWYCVRPNGSIVDPSPKKATYPNNRLLSQLQQQQQHQQQQQMGSSQHNYNYNYNSNQQQPQAVPFPAFPAFRRHSSESLFAYEVQEPSNHEQQQLQQQQQQQRHHETWIQNRANMTNNNTGSNRGTGVFWGDPRGDKEDGSMSSVSAGDDASSTATTDTGVSSTTLSKDDGNARVTLSRRKEGRRNHGQEQLSSQLPSPPPIDRTASSATGCSSIPPPPPPTATPSRSTAQQQQQQPQQQSASKQLSLLARRPSAKNLPPLGRGSSVASSVGGTEAALSPHHQSNLNNVSASTTTTTTTTTTMLLQHNKDAVIGLPPSRGRCDTGEYSKMSHTTTSSRHRRQGQFRFSQHSMELIIDGYSKHENPQQQNQSPVPPPIVTTKIRNSAFLSPPTSMIPLKGGDGGGAWKFPAISPNDSGYISPLENDDDCDGDDLYEYDHRDGNLVADADPYRNIVGPTGEDEDSLSPFAQLDRKVMQVDNENVIRDGKEAKAQHKECRSSTVAVTPTTPTSSRTIPFVPNYLCKSPLLEEKLLQQLKEQQGSGGAHRVIFSGWVAASMGSEPDSFEQRQLRNPQQSLVSYHDLHYLCLTENDATGCASLVLCQSHRGCRGSDDDDEGDNERLVVKTYSLERDWIVQTREVSARVGRCVVVRRALCQPDEQNHILTLLPVSLQQELFVDLESGTLISPTDFAKQRDQLFVPQACHHSVGSGSGSGSTGFMHRAYAPDEQQDAVMHLMFSVGASIRSAPLA